MYDLSDICSLCLEREKNLKSIISTDTDGTLVAEKIRIFLIEIIHFKPHLQKYICNNCLESLNFIHKFREKCLENILKLNEFVQKLDQQQSCKNYAVQNSSESCENEIESEFIKEEPEDYDESTDHTEENDHELEYVLKMEIEETKKEIDFQSSYDVYIECKEEEENITSSHKPPSADASKNRKYIKTNDGKLKCSECEKSFKLPSELDRHYSVHSTERPYGCQICHKAFKQRGALSMHMHSHTGDRPYECDLCQKAFSQKINLIIHKRIHSNLKPFKCSECTKAFTTNSNLTVHMRSHTGEKPFQCFVCTYGTVTRTKLTQHIKTHDKRVV